MSDYAIDLLKAIESGDRDVMGQAFNTAINAKIGDAIDAKKIEVAQSVYSLGSSQSDEESSADSGEEVNTTETSEEDDTQEV